jgi:acyl-CoA dehydrogenase
MTKVFCSEALARVVDRCLQVMGSIGITKDTVIERIYRDIRPFRIYDGPSEVHRHALAQRLASRGPFNPYRNADHAERGEYGAP